MYRWLLFFFFIMPALVMASGGYDHGTPAGKGNTDIDITINPGNKIKQGQSYLVWGYGLTNKFDFQGYVSHEANGTDQIYLGIMYNFYSNNWLDLSSAFGFRIRKKLTDAYIPQLLYTLKLPNNFDIGGSIVHVYNTDQSFSRGITYDIALRIPISKQFFPSFVKQMKLAVGVFRNAGGNINPTYSVDFKF